MKIKSLLVICIMLLYSHSFGEISDGYHIVTGGLEVRAYEEINIYKNFPTKIIVYKFINNKIEKYSDINLKYKFDGTLLNEQIIDQKYFNIFKIKGFQERQIYKYIYKYQQSKLMKIYKYLSDNINNLSNCLIDIIDITYNSNNNVKNILKYDNKKELKESIEFYYDKKNLIKKIIKKYFKRNNSWKTIKELHGYYNQNKITEIEEILTRRKNKYGISYNASEIIKNSSNAVIISSYDDENKLVKEIENFLQIGSEHKYQEINLSYDNMDRLEKITINYYNNPTDKNKFHTMWDSVIDFYY